MTETMTTKGSGTSLQSRGSSEVRRQPAPWPKDALRIAFGVIWAIDASLKWAPGFKSAYMSYLTGAAQGQPSWLHPWFQFWINLQRPDHVLFWALVATVETLIAAALILGVARKLTYASAMIFSLFVWSIAEGFGGPYTSGASDVGTSIIYVVVFAALLAINYYEGPARYSLDYLLERRIGWWWRIAEMRNPARLA